jgi:dTDP-4-amino-4,6-dideoxygalactose transaminase
MNIPLMDLSAQYRAVQSEIDAAIRGVLEKGHFILGPNVKALEQEVAAYLGVAQGVGVGNGTDALVLALRALDIGPGAEVIVPAYTFFATAEAVLMVGAKPVLVDSVPDTYCLDVAQVAGRITARTRAIIPVHLYGHPADMTPLLALAREHGLKVIEDNAQAFGAEYLGRKTGSLADVGCLSFFPSKNLGGYGDGGMVVTNDAALAERVRMLRTHGWKTKYHPELVGYNSRLDELQAAILRVNLRHVDAWNERRRTLAQLYTRKLSGLGIGLPKEANGARHVYHLYMIALKERARVQQQLEQNGIASAQYYPLPMHRTAVFRNLGLDDNSYPVAEAASTETLAIPFFPEMSEAQLDQVVGTLERALLGAGLPA